MDLKSQYVNKVKSGINDAKEKCKKFGLEPLTFKIELTRETSYRNNVPSLYACFKNRKGVRPTSRWSICKFDDEWGNPMSLDSIKNILALAGLDQSIAGKEPFETKFEGTRA